MLLGGVIVLVAVLSQRFLISVDTGGRGEVSALTLATLCLGAMSLFGRSGVPRRIDWGRLLVFWGPYWACVGLLPLFAVLFQSYPTRVLFSSVTDALFPMAIVATGAKMSCYLREPTRALAAALAPAVFLVLGYAACQAAYSAGVLDAGLWAPLAAWDRSVADALRVVQGSRPSGPYVNPNILGTWGALAFVLSATLMRGRLGRTLTMGAALLTVFLSQSRGSLLALVAGAAVLMLMKGEAGVDRTGRVRATVVVVAVTVAAWIGVGLAGGNLAGASRFLEGFVSLLPGSAPDPAVAGRFDFWSHAVTLNAMYPLGTFGPPEALLGTAVDNDWIRLFLQASMAGVVAAGVMLIGGTIFADRSRLCGRALTASSVVVALSALSETPLGYPPIALYWVVVGFCIVEPLVLEKAANA
jgi:hypothetical protein